ncbi:MAG: hypothetical protein RIG93_26445 [Roseibium album]|uniref:hypothetical protein n=1 Tax=Roseibium album TaxID=311410 RepID=UPI0032EBC5E7
MDKLSALFELRCLLRKMEADVGLEALTPAEMDVFLAAHSVTEKLGEAVASDQIRQHEMASCLAQATYHRALRSLVRLGLLEKAEGCKARQYVVRSDIVSQ